MMFAFLAIIGIVLVLLRRRITGGLAIGLGLLIIILAYWHYGGLTLWVLFFLSLLWAIIYTPIAFRDEVEELYERARRQQVARTQTNSSQDSELSFGKIFTAAFLADASVHLGEKILKKLKK